MKFLITVAMAALLLGGCAQKSDTTEAVKQGVIRDLASKFDMSKMDVLVDSVSFRDKEADATVTFVAKGGSAGDGMTMRYVMERHDDHQWYIKSRASAVPGGTAPGSTSPGATGGGSGALPAGHPDLNQ